MIYLNNAATTYPKPQTVYKAYDQALQSIPLEQFRGADVFAGENGFDACRKNLGKLLGIQDTDRIFFSSGATDSLNKIILGMQLNGKSVMTTTTEHNSVLRPLWNHPLYKDKLVVVPCDDKGELDLTYMEQKATQNVGALIVNHCSNVTGMVQNLKRIGELIHKNHILFIVDASQSAGCIDINVDKIGIDILVFTGHKSLLGPQGTGGFYVKRDVPFIPCWFGGTGKDSSKLLYAKDEYEFEVGTQNGPGIKALNEGVCYVLSRGIQNIVEHEKELMEMLYTGLESLEKVTVYGDIAHNHGPLLSFTVGGLHASDVAYILQQGNDIVVRTGLHCAPLIHEALGTDQYGTIRVSISDFTTKKEIEIFLKVIEELNQTLLNRTK